MPLPKKSHSARNGKAILPRRREEREGHQKQRDLALIQDLQDFLSDLRALAVKNVLIPVCPG
jgi:hypothetical protein